MKKTIQSIIGAVLILAFSGWVFGVFSSSKKTPEKNTTVTLKSVVTKKVVNSVLPIQIKSTGSILAKDRTVLYSEVQGIFQQTSKPFKPGVRYSRGQALIRINNTEYAASVKSQRINFKSLITGTLADIQFDYQEELITWKNYANSISPDKSLPALPKSSNENFTNYISGKSVFSNYYSIKNLETRLAKYVITAPFSGVLVVANITPGTLVSPGQKLGEFIKIGIYELELNVNASMTDFLKLGKKVTLFNTDHSSSYQGVVSRINSQIDRASQTVQLFVEVRSNDLSEGEYLEADINAQNVSNVYEINRSLIVDENNVFIVEDGLLVKQPISIIHTNENSLIVKGIKDSSELIAVPVPGGYEGMKVSIKN
ncbi:HlyD family efflux transporter periplasmic adaptor subunit [Flavobacteriales bacterium]|nr:HlyD family efflux transporter periplasmic adaptor subunit [Flavobacteriales bacterium]